MKDPKKMNLLLMGTPELARDVFQAIHQAGYTIIGLVCQPDTEVGRERILTKPPTKIWAEANRIPVYQPEKIRLDHGFLNNLDIDFILTLAYGQIVPQAVLDKPHFGAFNFHGSLLPKYRGASPIRFALIHHEEVTGMSLMKMVLAMDAGPVYAMKRMAILPDDNYSTLLQRFSPLTIQFALQSLPRLFGGELTPVAQLEKDVTFAPMITKEDEHLKLTMRLPELLGWIRGLAERPGGYFISDNKKIKILQASIIAKTENHPLGTLIKVDHQGIHLQVLGGVISLDMVQFEGKGKMSGQVFGNGHRHLLSTRLT
jgi:methionyl-tRNA formyltransferase